MGKYFGTDGYRGEANVNLTADSAFRVGKFLGWYYGQQKKNGEHGEMKGAEMRPAEARRDGINGFPEIGHSTAICLSLRLLNSTP